MPTLIENKAPSSATDAEFREWAKFVSDSLANAGWVQTSDTGQIDLTTVTRPTSNNESRGYQIWRTNDSLTPIYLKIEYGAALVNAMGIWCQLGWGSNGSGTLTGNTTTRHRFNADSNTSTTYPCYSSGSPGRFCLGMFSQTVTNTNYSMVLVIERLLSVSGTPIDNAAWIAMYGASNGSGISVGSNASQVCLNGGTNPSGIESIPVIHGRSSSNIIGSTVGMFPVLPIGQVPYPAALGCLGFFYNDIGDATTVVVPRYGTNRTYLALRLASTAAPGFGRFSGNHNLGTFTSSAVAILWE